MKVGSARGHLIPLAGEGDEAALSLREDGKQSGQKLPECLVDVERPAKALEHPGQGAEFFAGIPGRRGGGNDGRHREARYRRPRTGRLGEGDCPHIGRGRGSRTRGGNGPFAEEQLHAGDLNPVPVVQRHPAGHALAVEEGAVAAALVLEEVAAAVELHHGV